MAETLSDKIKRMRRTVDAKWDSGDEDHVDLRTLLGIVERLEHELRNHKQIAAGDGSWMSIAEMSAVGNNIHMLERILNG